MLWRYKKKNRLNEAGVRLQIGFLYEAMRDKYWYFEVKSIHLLFPV